MKKLVLLMVLSGAISACKGGGESGSITSPDFISSPSINVDPLTYEFTAQLNLGQAQYTIESPLQTVWLDGLDRALDFDTTELKMLLYLEASYDSGSPVCSVVIESNLVDNFDGTYTIADRTTHCEPCSNEYNAEGSVRPITCNNTTENQIQVGNTLELESISASVSRLHIDIGAQDIYYQFDVQ